jgi:hypothetical protein
MAAGLGFKDFVTGEVLTAADVDGYLMQGVWVFASAAARDAAVTSPQEGNFAYLKDTNVTTYYTGSAWANLDTTGMTNPMTTTGDTIYSSSGSTPARLGIGTAGQVLQVNSGATAPEWATPTAGGGLTLIQEQVANANTGIDFTSISGSYKQLLLTWHGIYESNTSTTMSVRFNNDSGNNYHYMAGAFRGGSQAVESGAVADITDGNNGLAPFGYGCDKTVLSERAAGYLLIDNYSSATKLKEYYGMFRFKYTTVSYFDSFVGTYDSTTAITQVNIVRLSGAGTMSNATNTSIRLYGIS